MKKNLTLLAAILLLTAGCEGSKNAGSSGNDMISVDVTANYPKKEVILQDMMDVEYIPLETNDEFVTMGWVHAIGKEYIVVRNRSRASDGDIFIFDRKGKAVRKINHMGGSGEEYVFLLGVTLDEENNEIFVNDRAGKMQVYDLQGIYKRSLSYPEKTLYTMDIYNFDRDHLIGHDGYIDWETGLGNSHEFIIVSKRDGSISRRIEIPYNKKISSDVFTADRMGVMPIRNRRLIPQGDGWSLMENSSDTVYLYTSDHSMKPVISRTPSIQAMNPGVFLFPAVLTDRYCFMQTVKAEWDWENNTGHRRVNLMYDRKNNALYEYVMYNADITNDQPVIMTSEVTVGDHEVALVHKLEVEELLEAYEKGQLKGKLKDIAAELEEDSNPVLMVVKYKK